MKKESPREKVCTPRKERVSGKETLAGKKNHCFRLKDQFSVKELLHRTRKGDRLIEMGRGKGWQ